MKNKQVHEQSLADLAYAGSLRTLKALSKLRHRPLHAMDLLKSGVMKKGDIETETAVNAELSRELPLVKRHSYDQSIVDLVASTYAIETDEVVGQLANIALPFDKIWIEGPGEITLSSGKHDIREGYLINAHKEGSGFSFHAVILIEGRQQIVPFAFPINVLPHEGIKLDEERLVEFTTGRTPLGQAARKDSVGPVESYYKAADFVCRMLLIIGSGRVASNFSAQKSAADIQNDKNNHQRARMNLKPRLPAEPIKIDLGKVDLASLSDMSAKEVRVLLGWTSVRRSKPIMKKDGTFFTRKPHDRKIAAAIDRRNATRELFTSNADLTLSISNIDRPPRLVALPKGTVSTPT